jgi:dicarboxylate transporter 10
MTSDSMRAPEKRYGYSNGVTGLFSLAKEEGIRGLCRGLGTNTVRLCFLYSPVLTLPWLDKSCFDECV